MKIFFSFLILNWIPLTSFAGVHVHGSASLGIAFERQNGKIEFKAPAESILGFEYLPSTPKDKKKLELMQTKFEKEIPLMVRFEPSVGCAINKDKIQMSAPAGEHADFIANYFVGCARPIRGSQITVDFSSFRNLKDLDITVLVDDLQKSVKAKGKPVVIVLKK